MEQPTGRTWGGQGVTIVCCSRTWKWRSAHSDGSVSSQTDTSKRHNPCKKKKKILKENNTSWWLFFKFLRTPNINKPCYSHTPSISSNLPFCHCFCSSQIPELRHSHLPWDKGATTRRIFCLFCDSANTEIPGLGSPWASASVLQLCSSFNVQDRMLLLLFAQPCCVPDPSTSEKYSQLLQSKNNKIQGAVFFFSSRGQTKGPDSR